jgi:hypothetical protein
MSRPITIYWPNFNNPIGNPQPLVLQNANIPLIGGTFQYDGMIRSIDVISTDNQIAGTQYQISGIGCTFDAISVANAIIPTSPLGPVSEIINAGAANVPSPSVMYIYSEIDSVKVLNHNATNVGVSYGSFGITDYISTDYNKMTVQAYSNTASLQFIAPVGVWGSVWFSLNKISTPDNHGNFTPFGLVNGTQIAWIPAFELIGPSQANTYNSDSFGSSTIWASVTNCTADSMYFTFLQQGMR